MTDFWPRHRVGSQSPQLVCRYEKAGLVFDQAPVPWNADALLVEGHVRLPESLPRRRSDFQLRLAAQEPVAAEEISQRDADGLCRLHFRVAPPSQTTLADLLWRGHLRARVTVPCLGRDEFFRHLSLQLPTVSVCLANYTVPCQTFVASQGRGLIASAVLTSATPLAPLADLGLRVEFRAEPSGIFDSVPVTLSQAQLSSKQTTILVTRSRLPRRSGHWQVSWMLGDRLLASQRVRSIATSKFLRSLRLTDTRLVVQTTRGRIELARHLSDPEGVRRLGPCFLVTSNEPGMAGLCTLQVRGQTSGGVPPPLLAEQEVLITDGPTPFAPGTEDLAQVSQLRGFELWLRSRPLGCLPLAQPPSAHFTSEGGFKAPGDFAWSSAAEEQLHDRLAKLM
jgi:hypothetical protein